MGQHEEKGPVTRPTHLVRATDGTLYQQEEPPLSWSVTMTVLLDGQMRPIGLALAILLAQRQAGLNRIQTLESYIGDLHEKLQQRGIDPSTLLEEG